MTIVAFGSWFYGFGVLIEPIRLEDGFSATVLGATFSVSMLLTGIGATVAGRVLDSRGSRTLYLVSAVLAGALLGLMSIATHPLAFLVAGGTAGGLIGAVGYYHAPQAVLARLAPEHRTRTITVLTLYGAFASPLFMPAMGWFASTAGWRPTVRILAVAVTCAFLAAAFAVPDVRPHADDHVHLRDALRMTWRSRPVRLLMAAGFAGGMAASLLLLYQVPAMGTAGLALTTAATLAGARGFVQLAGRIPLPFVVDRIGARRSLRISFLLVAVGAVLLLGSGTLVIAIAFVAVAGVAIGALAALEGIYASEVVDPRTIGTALGVYSLVRGVGGTIGPAVGGASVDATGAYTVALVLSAVAAIAAAAVLPSARGSQGGRPHVSVTAAGR
jgi:MFS family permease